MMLPANYFNDLQTRFDELDAKFIEPQVRSELEDPLNYSPDLDKLAAFRLLLHAEIEEYLERKAKECLERLKNLIQAPMKIRDHLHLYALASLLNQSLPFESPFNEKKFLDAVKDLLKEAERHLDNNNGIKASSFLHLSVIAGKAVDDIDAALADKLTQYGRDRGSVAHRSVRRVTTIEAPSTEQRRAREILEALKLYYSEP